MDSQGGDENKNKLVSLGVDDHKLLEKYKTIWTNIWTKILKYWVECFTSLRW